MMEACSSPQHDSPTFTRKTFSHNEDLKGENQPSNQLNGNDKASFTSGETVSTTHSLLSESDIEIKLALKGASGSDSSIPTSLLSEEETLETLIQNSSAFLKDLDVPTLGGNISKIPSITSKRTRKKLRDEPNNPNEADDNDDDLDSLIEDNNENHHDEMLDDLSRLAAAEEDIRMELEMLMNTGFDDFVPTTTSTSAKNDRSDLDTDDESLSQENPRIGFDFASPTAHKSKHKRRKKKMLQSLSMLCQQDSESEKNIPIHATPTAKPKTFNIDWKEHGEEIGIQRMIHEEIKDNIGATDDAHKVYKCPLPNSIYDLIMDGEMERRTSESNDAEESPTKQLFRELEVEDLDLDQDLNTLDLDPKDHDQEEKKDTKVPTLSSRQKEILLQCNSEYILPKTSQSLRNIYEGLLPPRTTTSTQAQRNLASNSLSFLKDVVLTRIPKIDVIEKQFKDQHDNLHSKDLEQLPFRTCTLRIRPDVLCGAVMDALSHVIMIERNGEIMKRQGGHLIAVLPGFWFKKKKKKRHNLQDSDPSGEEGNSDDINDVEVIYNEDFNVFLAEHESKKKKEKKKKRKLFLPPLCMDAQLCTKKRGSFAGDHCERILLIRFYEIREKVQAVAPMLDPEEEKNAEYGKENNEEVKEKYSDEYDMLRDAAYVLFQDRKEKQALNENHGKTNPESGSESDPLETISLEDNTPRNDSSYVSQLGNMLTAPIRIISDAVHNPIVVAKGFPKPPHREEEKLIKIFSSTNSNLYQSSFRFLTDCISELETRELLYTTLLLPTSKFGTFPALPTIDVHFCAQIRSACREAMIMNLIKTASGLEQFAKDYEMECLAFVRLLVEGSIKDYGMRLPIVPKLVPLTGYPLNHESPEDKHPPWGQKVMDAMQRISSNYTSEQNHDSSISEENITQDFDQASRAAQMVVFAFCKQNDEELAARVLRKNLQVMDRMIKMQGLKRRTVLSIRDSFKRNGIAANAANRFHFLASQAKILTVKSFSDFDEVSFSPTISLEPKMTFPTSNQIPILKCGIVAKNAPGTCYVTAYQILFVINVGFLSGDDYTLATIADIDLTVEKDLTNPSLESTVVSVKMRETGKQKRYNSRTIKNSENSTEVFSFIPSISASQFKTFVDTIRAIDDEENVG